MIGKYFQCSLGCFSIYFPGGVEEQLSLPYSWSSSLDRTGAAPTSAKDKTVHGGACSTKFRQLAAVRRASSRVGKLSRAAALAHPRKTQRPRSGVYTSPLMSALGH